MTSSFNLNTMILFLTTITARICIELDSGEPSMADNGFLSGGDTGTTYIRPIGGDWKKVTYAVVGDLAVFEGCIVLGTVAEVQEVAEFIKLHPELLAPAAEPFGAAIKGVQYRWKNKTVPYEIDEGLPDKQRVRDAIAHWVDKVGFKFVERTAANRNDPALADYVVFRGGGGCASTVGRKGGAQNVILGPGCTAGNCIHEIGHTIGLWHEQSRADRDTYITIKRDNIAPNMLHNFDQHVVDGIDLGTYDYGSIMHYPKDAFSQNGGDTIVPKQEGAQIGQRTGLSAGDIAAVKNLYP
ncbi:Dot/Icm T4SS effector Zinc-dependent metalloprotease LegP [Bradyrhizobium sp. DN5]|uniref:Dot/Icm T4SS effector Zinc-dependent metalloprotease LegP n=1 Tax=Bradyrhizobium sp. DN5 TaxID=3056950 RepID=UPI00352424DD